VYLGERDDVLPRLVFQPVSEPKRGKTRIHLDVVVDDIAAGMEEARRSAGRSPASATITTKAS
jgi:hypothetical protein